MYADKVAHRLPLCGHYFISGEAVRIDDDFRRFLQGPGERRGDLWSVVVETIRGYFSLLGGTRPLRRM